MSAKKLKIAVLFGGKNPEHWISFKSGMFVLLFLDRSRYEVSAVYVRQDGSFSDGAGYLEALDRFLRLNSVVIFSDSDEVGDWKATLRASALQQGAGFFDQAACGQWDLLFPVFHGRFGEDGTIQGLAEMLGLPYAGCSMEGSVLGIDKPLTKHLSQAHGLSVAPYHEVLAQQWRQDAERLKEGFIRDLGLPLFVKPARLGSSIGVGRATDARELSAVLEEAFRFDYHVLVESEIHGSEFAVGVMGTHEDCEASVVVEYTMQPETYDYESKYGPGAPEDIIPARLSPEDTERMKAFAKNVFRALGMSGICRVDSFWSADGPVLNEVNTMPGLNARSPFIRAWEASGLSKRALMDRIVELALERNK